MTLPIWLLFRREIDARRAVTVCACTAGSERDEDARALQRRFPNVLCATKPDVPGRHVVALEECLAAIEAERAELPAREPDNPQRYAAARRFGNRRGGQYENLTKPDTADGPKERFSPGNQR